MSHDYLYWAKHYHEVVLGYHKKHPMWSARAEKQMWWNIFLQVEFEYDDAKKKSRERAKKTILHINQHIIKANAKTGARDPVITVKSGKSNRYAHEAIIKDKDGNEVARVVYSPDKPLSCGARVWVESKNPVELIGEAQAPMCLQ